MDDDFNTARALGILFELAGAVNQAADVGISIAKAQGILTSLAREVLGLRLETSEFMGEPVPEIEQKVNRMVEERLKLRKAKQWQEADKIRAELAEMGVTLEDTPDGTVIRWERKR
jgi:cysteinyl-tRNA synthetase